MHRGVWVPPEHQPKSHQNIIIFDWDDTLLCSTFFTPEHFEDFELIKKFNQKPLAALENQVVRFPSLLLCRFKSLARLSKWALPL